MITTDTKANREKGTDLFEIHQELTRARIRNGELIDRIAEVGHKLVNTNFPPDQPGDKKEPVPATGLIPDIRLQITLLEKNNEALQAIAVKLEGLI